MMKNWIIGVLLLGTVISYGQIYQGSTQLGTSMSLDITLNTNTDSVSMEFSGPSSGYYAVGFGGTGMTNTYTVVVNSNGTVQERKLGNHQGGNVLSASVAYNAVVAGGVRTAYIERARAGASGNHYTFSSNGGAINLIWAKGGTSFGNHGGSNRGFASINLVDQCNLPVTTLATKNICPGDSVQVFGEWISQSGIYYDSLSTPLGCDSIVQQSVQYTAPVINTLPSLSICQGDSIQIFGTWVTTAITLYDSLSTLAGCDSIVAQEVLVNNTINNTIASTGLCAGDSVFYLDAWRTDTGTVVYSGVTAAGCDSMVTGRVEYLPTVDTGSIWVAPYTDASFYVGLDTGATYYWFHCNTGVFVDTTSGADTLNPGNEFLQAPDTGFYAAIIVKPGYCSDTSACYYFYMEVPEYDYGISLRPIPTQKDLEITVDNFTSPIGYQLLSVSGRVLETGLLRSNSTLLDVRHYATGMYLLRLEDGRTIKWMKE
ncbi:MAG: T9SS type A sorting domain-containing protein [Schleiferiaceae bacterium]